MQINNVFEVFVPSQARSERALSPSEDKGTFEKELAGAQEQARKPESGENQALMDKKEVSGSRKTETEDVPAGHSAPEQETTETEDLSDESRTAVETEKTQDSEAGAVVSDDNETADDPVIDPVPAGMQVVMGMAMPAKPEDGIPLPPEEESVVPSGMVTDENASEPRPAAMFMEAVATDGRAFEQDASKAANQAEAGEETQPVSEETAVKEAAIDIPADTGNTIDAFLTEDRMTAKPEVTAEAPEQPVAETKADGSDRAVPAAASIASEKAVAAGKAEYEAAAMPIPEDVLAAGQDGTEQPEEIPAPKRRNTEVSAAAVSEASVEADPSGKLQAPVEQAVRVAPDSIRGHLETIAARIADKQAQRQENASGNGVTDASQQQSVSPVINGMSAAQPQQVSSAKDTVIPAPAGPDVNAMVGQIVKQAQLAVKENRSEMVIRLQPENLGTLNMTIVTQNDSVSITIQCDNKAVKKMLESNISQLAGSLSGQGMKVDGLGITIAQRSAETGFNFHGFGWGSMLGNGASPDHNAWARFSDTFGPADMAGDNAGRDYHSVPAGLSGRMQGWSGSVDYLV